MISHIAILVKSKSQYVILGIAIRSAVRLFSGQMDTRKGVALVLDFGEIVSEFVRSARESRGWTQREMAKASRVAQATISNIETGGRTYRGVHIEQIFAALGLSGQAALIAMSEVAKRMEFEANSRVELKSSTETTVRGGVRQDAAEALRDATKRDGGRRDGKSRLRP